MPKLYQINAVVAATLLWLGCTPERHLRPGDIVFQQNNCGPLCESIDRVTEGFDGRDYNHCGLVVQLQDTLGVLEAIGKDVHLSSINQFINRYGQDTVLVGRLLPEYQAHIPALQERAMAMLGKPYDVFFEMNNEGIYCSELIYEAAQTIDRGAPLFALQPMTFRDPATHDFFEPWVQYYQHLNYPVPEGKPGINPGLLSRSDKLIKFYFVRSGSVAPD